MDVRIEIPASSSTESYYYSVQTHQTSSEENIDIPLHISSVDEAELDNSNASIETVVANQKPPTNNKQKKVSFVKTVTGQPAAVDFVDLDEITLVREEGKESEKSSGYVFYEYETVFPQEDHDLRMQILPEEAFRVRSCFKLTEIRSSLNLEFLRKILIKTWLTLVMNLIFLILFIIYSQLFIFLIYSTLDEQSTVTIVSRVCLLTIWAIQICMLVFGFVNIYAAACRNPGLLFKGKLNEIYANTKSITGIDNTAVEMDPLETRLVLYSRIIIELKLCQVKSFSTD